MVEFTKNKFTQLILILNIYYLLYFNHFFNIRIHFLIHGLIREKIF